jgi:HPt (histidine-containing phosphotransfer) domain-containing protein
MTAYCLKEDKIRFIEAGMDDFIAKPISVDKILTKVKYWTEKNLNNNQPSETFIDNSKPKIAAITKISELEAVFDFEALKSLLKHLGEEILLDSIKEFAMETEQMLVEIDSALATNNIELLTRITHTLKGNAGTFGVNHLSALAKVIENDLKNGKIADLSEQLEKLKKAANQFLTTHHLLIRNHEWKN